MELIGELDGSISNETVWTESGTLERREDEEAETASVNSSLSREGPGWKRRQGQR